MSKPITGRQVFFVTASAFGVIIAVNIFMAVNAVKTFPGLETKNSYVASQKFQAQREAQEQLGWTVAPAYEDGQLRLAFVDEDGTPVSVKRLKVLVGRTTVSNQDQQPEFALANGAYVAPLELERGKWMLQVQAEAQDGTLFKQRLDLRVRG